MDEYSLMADLLRKIVRIVDETKAERVTSVKVTLGALVHITPDYFRDHFEEATKGTVADGANLRIEQMTDQTGPHAEEIMLESVDVYESDEGSTYRRGVGMAFANSGGYA